MYTLRSHESAQKRPSTQDRALLPFHGGAVNEAYDSLSRVAALAGVSTGTVRHWRYVGWLDRNGVRRHLRVRGREYCASDALLAERDTRMSGQSHRTMVA